MSIRKDELLRIKNNKGQTIVGILERKFPKQSTRDAKIGIICHGVQAHKNFSFQPKLAKELSFDTFRFDFRGNGESDFISIDYGNNENEIEDIDTVVKYLEREYGYQLYALIGHSVGNISAYHYATKMNRNIPHFVAISARYHFSHLLKNYPKEYLEKFKNEGFKMNEYKFYGEIKRVMTTFEGFSNFVSIDMSFVSDLPESTSVFIIHGASDEYTSPNDAAVFSSIIPNNTLKIIMGANHAFTDHSDELISSITDYFSNEFQSTRFFERNKFITKIPRYLGVEGVTNFRDLGGYPFSVNLTQKYVRKRFIFRSGNLIGITKNGIKTLNLLNIQNVFDFRTTIEVQEIGFANIPEVNRIHISVFKDVDHSRDALLKKLSLYSQGSSDVCMIILDEGRSAYKVVFQHILNYPNRPFIIHGAVGNDRTGMFCMLVLKLCGVNDDIIAREYEITDRNIQHDKDTIKTYYDVCKGYFTMDEIRKIMSSEYESMILTLHKFSDIYGTVENYLNEYLGFTQQEIDQIKNNLMADYTENINNYNRDNGSLYLKSVL
ncbi:protein-tyrosine phosphatase-like protein [Glomus cerebriforme]|uniref:Protein-tyrosine phosphatase-like protein n=1 Tax=Glomus cerebriforme TaxID=658196 RepID=A0A397SHF3_9GLOM|nr:protein-tyrosine phosphatase-like protein [Glomus cerebriforme]